MTLHRQPDQAKTPTVEDVAVCPSCEQDRLQPHCENTDRHTPCGWLYCTNRACRSYGIPGVRWCDMRRRPAA